MLRLLGLPHVLAECDLFDIQERSYKDGVSDCDERFTRVRECFSTIKVIFAYFRGLLYRDRLIFVLVWNFWDVVCPSSSCLRDC